MSILTTNDFTGIYKIAFDGSSKDLINDIIVRYEKEYLVKLFGYELYTLFIADLGVNPQPTAARFQNVFNDLCILNGEECLCSLGGTLSSKGIKDMLKGLLYYHFVNEYSDVISQTAPVRNKNENADNSNGNAIIERSENRFNTSVGYFNSIANYMSNNYSIYPEYKGELLSMTFWGGAF